MEKDVHLTANRGTEQEVNVCGRLGSLNEINDDCMEKAAIEETNAVTEVIASAQNGYQNEADKDEVFASERYPSNLTNYKALYEECDRKSAQQAERFQKRLIQLINDYDEVKDKYDKVMEENKSRERHTGIPKSSMGYR